MLVVDEFTKNGKIEMYFVISDSGRYLHKNDEKEGSLHAMLVLYSKSELDKVEESQVHVPDRVVENQWKVIDEIMSLGNYSCNTVTINAPMWEKSITTKDGVKYQQGMLF